MNARQDDLGNNETTRDSALRFGSDRGAIRSEDAPLVTGGGQFTDDIKLSGQAYATFVRAPVAHAEIRNFEVADSSVML
jgi:carbon-monoxide dehydrogenase large subunit